jgi:ubiquinone/menaquinone biosynthesis C-methylase UbiE
MEIKQINSRYTELSNTDCCLSCGGAIDHALPVPGEVCVDLGSGKGTDVLRMAGQVGEKGFVYGIDISDGMLEKARRNAVRLGVSNVLFLCNDLEKLELQDASADLVISNCTINHAADKQAVWNGIHRILKMGGRFVVSDIYAVEEIPGEYRNDPVAVAECWAGAITREEYLHQLEVAGFGAVEVLEESAPYRKGQADVASITIRAYR